MSLDLAPSKLYIGKFRLAPLQHPDTILLPGSRQSLSQTYLLCFHSHLNNLGFLPPSITYVLTTDPCYQHIVAAISLSRRLDELPELVAPPPNSYYLFNACTHPCYRGYGYMQELIRRARQDVLTYEITASVEPIFLYLTVKSDNVAALRVYTKLGFIRIGTSAKTDGSYDIMRWSSRHPNPSTRN